MTIEQFIEEVRKINPAINCFLAGAYKIDGNFRGKKSEKFQFDFRIGEFDYNTCSYPVAAAFKQVFENI